MDAVTMQYNFDNKFRAHKKASGITLSSADIELFLNNAQENIFQKYAKTFEGEDYSRIVLMKLYKIFKRSAPFFSPDSWINSTNLTGGRYFALPTDYKYSANLEEASLLLNGVTYCTRVKPITDLHYNINENANNPYKKPYDQMVWRTDYGITYDETPGRVHQVIIPYGYTLTSYSLHYLRTPLPITISTNKTCELDENVHYELIDEAVRLAIEAYGIGSSLNTENNK